MDAFDEGVAADEPAGAGVDELAAGADAGEGAPGGVVGGFGPAA
ncbi:MAG TPA: hypothetical protein VFM55_08590 [Micromonosporaceae bacterium]|nr:hypothetical protein [Micromonosporaceae bacterium]